jgi:hypothetical protein
MTTYEYHKYKYETTFHPALKEFYRLRMEGHSALCAINMIEDYAPCRCGTDKDKGEI